jgi:hypothetical protein
MVYYQWSSPNYQFYASVSCEKSSVWTVHIGSKKKPACITLTVYKNDPEGILQGLAFDEMCASNKPMPRGVGTREMLNSAIFFIKTRFKWVKRISLTDVSAFRCDSKTVPLSEMFFLIHQKTWYERYFNATPVAFHHSYEALKETYRQWIWDKNQWFSLWNKYLNRLGLPEDDVFVLFHSNPKATEFFAELYKKYGCRPFKNAFESSMYPFLSFLHTDLSRLDGTLWEMATPTKVPEWFSPVRIKTLPEMDWTPAAPAASGIPKWFGGRCDTGGDCENE